MTRGVCGCVGVFGLSRQPGARGNSDYIGPCTEAVSGKDCTGPDRGWDANDAMAEPDESPVPPMS